TRVELPGANVFWADPPRGARGAGQALGARQRGARLGHRPRRAVLALGTGALHDRADARRRWRRQPRRPGPRAGLSGTAAPPKPFHDQRHDSGRWPMAKGFGAAALAAVVAIGIGMTAPAFAKHGNGHGNGRGGGATFSGGSPPRFTMGAKSGGGGGAPPPRPGRADTDAGGG